MLVQVDRICVMSSYVIGEKGEKKAVKGPVFEDFLGIYNRLI